MVMLIRFRRFMVNISPFIKVGILMASLGLVWAFPSLLSMLALAVCYLVLLPMIWALSSHKFYLMIGVPILFAWLGMVPLLFNKTEGMGDLFVVGYYGVTWRSVYLLLTVMLRSAASILAMFFFAFTTPVEQLLDMANKMRLPKPLIELVWFVFWQIQLLSKTILQVYRAQVSRLAYQKRFVDKQHVGWLVGGVFTHAIVKSQQYNKALEARGYNGELRFVRLPHKGIATNCDFK
jgi:cobalt/nickel transport system permease protein